MSSLVENYRESVYLLGLYLADMKQNRRYAETAGEGIDTWYDFLAQPEIGLTVAEANKLMAVARVYHALEEPFEISVANALVLSKGDDLTNADDARYLSTKDLKEKIFEDKEPEAEQTYTYLVMKKSDQTGNLSKVCGVSNEEVEQFINQHGHQ